MSVDNVDNVDNKDNVDNVDMPACLPANCNVMTDNDQSHCHWGRLAAGWRGGHQTQSELYWRTITNNTGYLDTPLRIQARS